MNMMPGLLGGDGAKLLSKLDEILEKQSKLEEDVAELREGGASPNKARQGINRQRSGRSMQEDRSLSRKSQARMNAVEPGELAPVLIGDYLVLQDLGSSAAGFVTGDPAFRRCVCVCVFFFLMACCILKYKS
jgi:hypothetical protein